MHLSALTLIIPDYDDAIAYYTNTLGFTLIDDIDQGHKRWIRIAPSPDAQTGIILAEPGTEEQSRAIGNQGAGRVWLFLETQDFAADHTRLTAAGVQFEESPRREPYGTVAVFSDTFGNRWDLIEYS
ncbi:VOC family protein [Sulfitobacter pacificus]|uniref:VOC domain-containing protein n=1 Tax=Sulfitobacter pacificus TaxID=1499314 RepID=A0ABQ5VIX9_9RHOB|nr:VOC family protein [Sulfitobacter pacificus]GLQ27077.1 hypothetical protein GCM10007927_18800 [Sulfitobacter pacificus]